MSNIREVPKLEDVAKAAGVSTATVSRCLNTPDRVLEGTKLKVFDAIEVLGYTPNFGARVMAAKRTLTIGAIIPTMENAIFARGLQAFQEELHDRGYTLLVSSSAYRPDIEEEQIRKLVTRGADGLLLIGEDRDNSIYQYLKRQEVSALIAWTYSADAPLSCVGFDNRKSMQLLTENVMAFGHNRIGVISGFTKGNDRARSRMQGIREALMSNGLDPGELAVIETSYEIECGAKAFDQLMALERPPTAIMCGNDVLAVGALKRARERNINVPGDVSITGFDDIELARIVDPALTTVHVPHREMGRQAACVLVDLLEKNGEPRSIELQTLVQIRGSLGRRKI